MTHSQSARAEYVYATAKTIERAQAILEDMYATGDVFECERPRIVERGARYCITLPA